MPIVWSSLATVLPFSDCPPADIRVGSNPETSGGLERLKDRRTSLTCCGKERARAGGFLRLGLIIIAFTGQVYCAGVTEPATAKGQWPGADLFSDDGVCQIRIEINPRDLASLRNEAREFVRANVTERGVFYPDVAIHLKGSVGSFRPLDEKPGFTLDFARFRSTQRFHGLRRLHLNNSVEDPSYCNEQLGSELFRSAGIPAPRVSRALVTLNERRLGLYVLKEGFTEDFLSCYFKKVGGNLFEPGEGHDVTQHLKRSSLPGPTQGRSLLKALGAAMSEADPHRRWNRLAPVLELDRFIDFMVMEVMLCHRDGYCLARNNFRVYQDLDTGKIVFFPHGMDQLFGSADLPWMPHMAGLVAEAILQTPEGRERYAAAFRGNFEARLKPQILTNRVNQITKQLHSWVTESEFDGIRNAADSLNQRILKRHRFLEAELGQSPVQMLDFRNDLAQLSGWVKADEPASGIMAECIGPDGIACLRIATSSEACPSWRTKALLAPGRYRFEGRVRVAGVKPLGFGAHQGAGLRVGGQLRQSENLIGTAAWQRLSAAFEVAGAEQEVQFICELRASAGEAWFDRASLRVVRGR